MSSLRTPWTARSYSPVITGSGAAKLSDSGVAPLIAMSRGYHSVEDPAAAKVLANLSAVESGHRTLGTKLSRLVAADEDILVIPWFRASGVAENGTASRSRTTQMRPSNPAIRDGKPVKYEFLPGESTTLDFHPSTPNEWLTNGTRIVMTEGVLKGDSALTALLLDAGVTAAELALPENLPTDKAQAMKFARDALQVLMLGVPANKRVPVLSFAGVSNWHNQSDWSAVKLDSKQILVAFDGDTSSNWQVWNQAHKLFTFAEGKGARTGFINFGSVEAEAAKLAAGVAVEKKLGMDDYLAHVSDWVGMLSLVEDDLPPEPEKKDVQNVRVGEWRVHPTNPHAVEEFAQDMNPDGSKSPAEWVRRYNIGGRIVSAESRRRPSREEVFSGQIQPELDAELSHSTCTIEVSFRDENDKERSVNVTGPANILAHTPADWVRQGANIPNALLLHPEWPPRKGAEWMSAIKANRANEIEQKNGWDTMGWVPTEFGHPAFIVGNNVLGLTPAIEENTVAGVTDKVLGGASAFGVIDTYRDEDLDKNIDAYKAQIRDDIRAVISTFLESGVWRDRGAAVTVLSAMLRPTIPAPITVTLYIYGPPRAGKTFSAAFIMSGWQSKPGTWSVRNLPGAAGDTLPSIEYSLARTPIWPADDLAPSVDKRQAEKNEADVGNLIRSVHNGSARRKMDVKTGMQKDQAEPKALFIITAENEPQVASVRERVVAVSTPNNAFGSEESVAALKRLCDVDGAPARLTAAMIRFWLFDNEFGSSWIEKTAAVRTEIADIAEHAEDVLQHAHGVSAGEAARHARIAAELAISLQVLRSLAEWADMPADDPALAKLDLEDESYAYDLFEMAGRTVKRQRQSTPGRSLVHTLGKLMLAGIGHVENPNSPGSPPAEADPIRHGDQAAMIAAQTNRSLGWAPDSQGAWMPKGRSLGQYGFTSKGDEIVLFDAVNAYREAQRNYPDRILPGQNATVGWSSVWSEGLCTPLFKKRADSNTVATVLRDAKNSEVSKAQKRMYGIPVLLEAIMNPTFGTDEADDEDELES